MRHHYGHEALEAREAGPRAQVPSQPHGGCRLSQGHWAPRVCALLVHADWLLGSAPAWWNGSGHVTALARPQFPRLSCGSLVSMASRPLLAQAFQAPTKLWAAAGPKAPSCTGEQRAGWVGGRRRANLTGRDRAASGLRSQPNSTCL